MSEPGSTAASIRVDAPVRARPRLVRWAWTAGGLLLVAIGGLGVVLPGLPSTIFFIGAAACFARSNPRWERWLLDLPAVGPAVRDYRAGHGMPRRAKVVAITMIVVAGTVSATFALQGAATRVALAAFCGIGIAVVAWYVPTREAVLRRAGLDQPVTTPSRSGSTVPNR